VAPRQVGASGLALFNEAEAEAGEAEVSGEEGGAPSENNLTLLDALDILCEQVSRAHTHCKTAPPPFLTLAPLMSIRRHPTWR
jgi:hypothetical protein